MKSLITILVLLAFSSCKVYERDTLLHKTDRGDYCVMVWDIKKYDRKTDSLVYHKIDTVVTAKIDDSNALMQQYININNITPKN